ncbi:hypothetical protein AYI69_g11197 [Smittium culicis]|uniref:Uncharacterized protein n=1 Tax=Smittium culicis TaxID=133412 RepID=A0A1R1X0E0_9FUNG|nr:hypothetical protein AYI69_g11197 [Smittium culicis]
MSDFLARDHSLRKKKPSNTDLASNKVQKHYTSSNINDLSRSSETEIIFGRKSYFLNKLDPSSINQTFESKDSSISKSRYIVENSFNAESQTSMINDIPKSIDSMSSPFNSTLLDYRYNHTKYSQNNASNTTSFYIFNVENNTTYTYTLLLSILLASRASNSSKKLTPEFEESALNSFYSSQYNNIQNARKSSHSLFSISKNNISANNYSKKQKEKTFSLIEIRTPLRTQAFSDYNINLKPETSFSENPDINPYAISNLENALSYSAVNSSNNKSKIKKLFTKVNNIKEKTNSFFKKSKSKEKSYAANMDKYNSIDPYKFVQFINSETMKISDSKIQLSKEKALDSADPTAFPYINTNKIILSIFSKKLAQALSNRKVHPLTQSCFLDIYRLLSPSEYINDVSKYKNLESFIATIIKLIISKVSSESVVDIEMLKQLTSHQAKFAIELLRLALESLPNQNDYSKSLLLKLNSIFQSQLENVFVYSLESYSLDNKTPKQKIKLPSKNIFKISQSNSSFSQSSHNPFVEWTRKLFGISVKDHDSAYNKLKGYATELNLNEDIQKCLNLTLIDQSFVCTPSDFTSSEAYNLWKQRELTSLDQLLELSIKRGMESAKEFKGSMIKNFTESNLELNFHLIPPNVYANYRNLISVIAHNDILSPYLVTPSTDYRVSSEADKILKICSISWRISGAFQSTCYLEVIKDMWIKNDLHVQYLYDSLGKVEQLMGLISQTLWTKPQLAYLESVCKAIELRAIYILEDMIDNIFSIDKNKASMVSRIFKYIDSISPTLNSIRSLGVGFDNSKQNDKVFSEMESSLSSTIKYIYSKLLPTNKASRKNSINSTEDCLVISNKILEISSSLYTSFPQNPGSLINKKFDVAGVITFLLLKSLLSDISKLNMIPFNEKENGSILSEIDLYRQTKKLTVTCAKYLLSSKNDLVVEDFLNKSVAKWMILLERESPVWMRNALLADKNIEFSNSAKHSTSVWDLLTSFSQQVTVASQINWPNPQSYGAFLTSFFRIANENFSKYTSVIEQQFYDIQKAYTRELKNKNSGKSPLYIKDQDNNTEIVTHFSFDTCIKLNNLYIAYKHIIGLIYELKVPQAIEDLGGQNRPSMLNLENQNSRFIYTIEVVNAEEIEFHKQSSSISSDNSKYPYVKLIMPFSDKSLGNKSVTVGKTRPVPPNAMNPRWEEEFEIEPHPLFSIPSSEKGVKEPRYPIIVELCSQSALKNLINKETVHGRGLFYLSKNMALSAGNSVDLIINLEPRGFLNLRISLNHHYDDVEYYCVRMINNLNRSLKDLQRRVSEKASSLIRYQLIKTLVSARDLNEENFKKQARDDISSFNENATVSSNQSFQPKRDSFKAHFGMVSNKFIALKAGLKKSPFNKNTKKDWDEGLMPIIDYLENNLHILYKYLYEDVAVGVILQIWKGILCSFEDIILPQLHGSSLGISKKLSSSTLESFYDSIEFFKWFFNGGDDSDGIPLNLLETQIYFGLIYVKNNYYLPTSELVGVYLEEIKKSPKQYKLPLISPINNSQSHSFDIQNGNNLISNSATPYSSHVTRNASKKQGHTPSYSLDIRSIKNNSLEPESRYERSQSIIKSKINNFANFLKASENLLNYRNENGLNSKFDAANSSNSGSNNDISHSFQNYKVTSTYLKNNSSNSSNIHQKNNPELLTRKKDTRNSILTNKRHSLANLSFSIESSITSPPPISKNQKPLFESGEEIKSISPRKADLILRLLKLSPDKNAKKFVKSQLDIRVKQLQFEILK